MLDFLRDFFDPLFDLLGFTLTSLHALGAPWWLAIVMLTIVARTLLFPLTIKQVKSMRNMQELKPDIDAIRTEHKEDPRKRQEELVKLYGERKVNPVGGCLPALVQLPIFLVLYYTIKEFETLDSFRTGGLLWFQDLTATDPLYILPVLYVVTMMASQEISARHAAPEQRKLMRFLPLVFGVVLAVGGFPAGLFVYWIASNSISFVQNYLIYRNATPTASLNQNPEVLQDKDTHPIPKTS